MMFRNNRLQSFLPLLFALVLALGVFLGGYLNRSFLNRPFTSSKVSHFNKLNEVVSYIEQEYVDTINEKGLVDRSITAILNHLDPHSAYIPAEDLQAVNESLEGNFDGIGVEFHLQNDTIMVVSPVTGGPSDAVGIKSGDRIIKIEGQIVAGVHIANTDVMQKLRGPSGTKVNVTVLRKTEKKPMNFTITRGKIPLYSIEAAFMANSKTGYIKIGRFAATTYDEYIEAFQKLKAQGMENLILDLKDNPGGYLNAATKLADEFLEKDKLIVYTQGKSRPRESYYSTAKGEFEKGKLVILIDEGSASASEILAGAIQDLDRGTIVGRRSFGKGLVQEQSVFPDGSAVRLTIARYYTPSGRCIQKSYKNGIEQYNDELLQRMKRGELEHPDSIKLADSLKYKTASGRIVYGGGGIMPDVFVPFDTSDRSPFFNFIFERGLINQFSFDYVDEHRQQLSKLKDFDGFNKSFAVTPELYSKFIRFAEKQGGKRDSVNNPVAEKAIKTYLKAFIARQIWKNEGYYRIRMEMEPAYKKALEIIEKEAPPSGS